MSVAKFETGEGFRSIGKRRNPSSGTDFAEPMRSIGVRLRTAAEARLRPPSPTRGEGKDTRHA